LRHYGKAGHPDFTSHFVFRAPNRAGTMSMPLRTAAADRARLPFPFLPLFLLATSDFQECSRIRTLFIALKRSFVIPCLSAPPEIERERKRGGISRCGTFTTEARASKN